MASWRDSIKVHPAADLFPLMPPDELRELGENIKKHGLQKPIVFWCSEKDEVFLLDGRNRLDAMEAVGLSPRVVYQPIYTLCGSTLISVRGMIQLDDSVPVDFDELDDSMTVAFGSDPLAYVVSANIHRRHLTSEQKRELVAKLLKDNPERSNLATAKIAKVDDKTVGTVRKELESRSEIPNVKARTDTKGRKQPARKRKTKLQPYRAMRKAEKAEQKLVKPEGNAVDPEASAAARKAEATDAEVLIEIDHAMVWIIGRLTRLSGVWPGRALELQALRDFWTGIAPGAFFVRPADECRADNALLQATRAIVERDVGLGLITPERLPHTIRKTKL